MENFWEIYRSNTWVEPFLVFSIAAFVFIAGLLFMLTLIKRSRKIEIRKNHYTYSILIERIFMGVIFEDLTYASIKENDDYKNYLSLKYFKRQMLKSIINMHHNYEGIYARKLKNFYFESGLMKHSVSKLKSQKWEVVCAGIQELAEMNITKVFPALVKISKTKNKTVKITALKACAELNGNKGILHLKDHNDPIDMWTQVNIINAFKRNYVINDNDDVELLLGSENSTVVSLGLKIIRTLELANKVPFVEHLAENSPNDAIKLEAHEVLRFLTI
jgi:hypothetical protein